MNNQNNMTYNLTLAMTRIIFAYYFLIMLTGIIISISIACEAFQGLSMPQILQSSIYISMAMSGALCSVRYTKKLYKACIEDRVIYEVNAIKHLGNTAYFVFRPIFAIIFSVIMVFTLLSGMFVVIGSLNYILNDKFLYLCSVLSSMLGYSTGYFLDRFELSSKNKISKIINM